MTQSTSSGAQNQQSGKPGAPSQAETQAQAAAVKDKVKDKVKANKSGHDHMSRKKAGSHEGAGGGAKQKEHGG